MSYEQEKNTASETELLSSDEQNVSRMLSTLKRVDVPKDFDFHLKARLANASQEDYRPVRLFPILKYAMPLALFLFVGAAFVLTNSYTGWNVPSVSELPSTSGPSVVVISNSGPQAGVNSVPTRVPDSELVAESPMTSTKDFEARSTKDSKLPKSSSPPSRYIRDGGSYDSTQKNSPDPIGPPGFGNSNSAKNPSGPGVSGPLETRQVLRNLGIDSSFGENGWTVKSLVKNGVAERSGLRVGDLMEAVDDKPIATLYDGSFSVKSISVRRDDKVVKIEIQNK